MAKHMEDYRKNWENIGITQATVRVPNERKKEISALASIMRSDYLIDIAEEEGVTEEKHRLAQRNALKSPYYKMVNNQEANGHDVTKVRKAMLAYDKQAAKFQGLEEEDRESDEYVECMSRMVAYAMKANAELVILDFRNPEGGGNDNG